MMTYNWDNMVEITVPKGTNGWVYSGEVTINGVKVRFPVGTPTTVPEPAAALLNKMIELEQEDDLSGAKPNNHYVGSVTVPDGKTLTLQKGAKVVDEAGVLGGNAGGGGVFVVNAEADNMDDNPFNATIDKTFAEIEEAYNAGQLVQMHIMIMGMQAIIPLAMFATGQAAMFQSLFMEYSIGVMVEANGSVEGQVTPLSPLG